MPSTPVAESDGRAHQHDAGKKPDDGSSRSAAANYDGPRPPNTNVKPRQIKKATHFGKADAKRDTILFVGFLAFMGLISYMSKDVGTPRDMTKSRPKTLGEMRRYQKLMRDALLKLGGETVNQLDSSSSSSSSPNFNSPPRMDCELFLAGSSIPGSGWGIFAGRNYSIGEEVIDMTGPWLTMILNGRSESEHNEEVVVIETHPYGLLLKPHKVLANVRLERANGEGEPSTPSALWHELRNHSAAAVRQASLVATQNILAGQEVFVRWEDHPHQALSRSKLANLFQSNHNRNGPPGLPTVRDYDQADALIRDAVHQFSKMRKQVSKMVGMSAASLAQKNKLPEITQGLQLTRKAVQRYDPVVASLLPISAKELASYSESGLSASVLSLKNVSHPTLAVIGRCLTDVTRQEEKAATTDGNPNQRINDGGLEDQKEGPPNDNTCESSSGRFLTSKAFVRKGETVLPVPLLFQDMTMTSTCVGSNGDSTIGGEASPAQSSCSSNDKVIDINPLQCLALNDLELYLCPLTNGVIFSTRDAEYANVQYQWSGTVNSRAGAVNVTDILSSSTREEILQVCIATKPLLW